MARQGTMVAYQGEVAFDYQSAGGIGKMLKKAVTGEGVDLMRVQRHRATCSSPTSPPTCTSWSWTAPTASRSTAPACWPSSRRCTWDIKMIGSAGMLGGGLFNTLLHRQRQDRDHHRGTPVVLTGRRADLRRHRRGGRLVGLAADLDQVVGLQADRRCSAAAPARRSSSGFAGQGFVVVQPSENPTRGGGSRAAAGRRRHRRNARAARRLTAGSRAHGRGHLLPAWRQMTTSA